MRELTDAERLYLIETQSLTLDEAGREALVGLTHEESCALMAYRRRLTAGNTDQDPENLSIWVESAEGHALARPLFDTAALSHCITCSLSTKAVW